MRKKLGKVHAKLQPLVKKDLTYISNAVAAKRRLLSITQEELAASIDVSTPTIQALENGRRIPRLPMLLAILRRLNLKLEIK